MHHRPTLTAHFRRLGVAAGDVVMLHASVRAVGPVAGGPDEIHLALKDALGESGTLLMYAGCPRYVDEIGRGNLTPAEEAELLEKLPPFDAATARCDRSHGILVELLRTYSGTHVNAHVARFAAWGKHAELLLAETPWHFAFGRYSALERFLDLDGKILLLGSDHDNVTFLHYAEHVVDAPGMRVARFKVPVVENGARVWRDVEEIDTSSNGAHPNWPESLFATLVDGHLAAAGNRGGLVGDAHAHLLSARGLLEHALPIMRSLAAAPR